MYITKMHLNLNSRSVIRDLNNFQQMHRTIMRAFPDAPKDAKLQARRYFSILYRVERMLSGNIYIIIQSKIAPDFNTYPSSYIKSRNNEKLYQTKKMDSLVEKIKPNAKFKFKMRCNPTKKLKGKRIELYKEDDQYSWIIRKSQLSGFQLPKMPRFKEIPAILVNSEGKQHGYMKLKNFQKNQATRKDSIIKKSKSYRRLTLYSVIYKGVLQVTKRDYFKNALERGIGPGKAYGYGLLSIAPL